MPADVPFLMLALRCGTNSYSEQDPYLQLNTDADGSSLLSSVS